MPLTPFHLGPALLLGLLLYRYVDLASLLAGSVLVDVRAALVLFGIVQGPMHGAFTTFAGALLVAAVAAGGVHLLREPVNRVLAPFRLDQQPSLAVAAGSAVVGAWSHVLLDALLYADAQPFAPLPGNPLLGLASPAAVYGFTLLCFLAAVPVYYRAWSAAKG